MNDKTSLKLIMISAMYENGGNTTHRMLDGHPELLVYPFESQLGTSLTADYLLSMVPFKYRWPEFPLSGEPARDYELFFDEEMKVMLRARSRSKFREADFELDERNRRKAFLEFMEGRARTRASLVAAFFHSTFAAWKNLNRSGKEKAWLGYSPVLVLDAEKMFQDFPNGQMIHVARNPYSGYADTKKRPFPLPLERYVWTWNFAQQMALTCAERFPKNFHLLRFEDLIEDPKREMKRLCQRLGLKFAPSLLYPSWNGTKMENVYPWGTIRTPTPEANLATMKELSRREHAGIKSLSRVMGRLLGYDKL
jgi:hypothetical protein